MKEVVKLQEYDITIGVGLIRGTARSSLQFSFVRLSSHLRQLMLKRFVEAISKVGLPYAPNDSLIHYQILAFLMPCLSETHDMDMWR